MGKITILPDILCNQIAAGEVIERPAAVVKELLENSIDAGSRKISVSLFKGGRKEVRIVDDGSGMDPDDALLALERHATSKLRNSSDLHSIHTLGFRGEALPSIAAVSRFELITREQQALAATQIVVEGGKIKEVREVGAPSGTTVTVRDLFYNMPARRKFLRTVETEMAHINDQFLRLALAYPAISFQLKHQGRISYDFPRTSNTNERVIQVLGIKLNKLLRPFCLETDTLRLHGLAGPPEIQRGNARSLFVYVNQRPVQERTVTRAILNAYDTLLPKGKYPVVILFLEVQPELVDVNVHPTKREVRFHRPAGVMTAVRSALEKALEDLQRQAWQRPLFSPNHNDFTTPSKTRQINEQQRAIYETPAAPALGGRPFESVPSVPSTMSSSRDESDTELMADGVEVSVPRFADLPIMGQLANAYIILQAPDGLVFIDQHAAHERILYDQLVDTDKPGASQRLLRPVILELLPMEMETLRHCVPYLNEIGFEIEPFGQDSFIIHAVPAALGRHSPEALIRDLLSSEAIGPQSPRLTVLSTLTKTAACHKAVRAGQKLARQEIERLLNDLDHTKVKVTCPHGRPLWWKLTVREIARFFDRT